MRWRYPLILIAFAVCVFVFGLAYGVVTVGVPTQDPTPAIAAAEARNNSISAWGALVGVCLFLVSLAWFAVIAVAKLLRRQVVA